MNEAETRAEHIDPALKAAGWGVVEGSRVMREHRITEGRLQGPGPRGKAEIADYVLVYRNTRLAVIEAKAWDVACGEGVMQAKQYAGKLAVRFTYATNGRSIYGIDMDTGVEGDVPAFPAPMNCGHGRSPPPTPGAIVSRRFHSRTRAAPGRAAITRTSRSSAYWMRLRMVATASC